MRRVFACGARIVFLAAIAFAVPAASQSRGPSPPSPPPSSESEPNLTRVELTLTDIAEYRVFGLADPTPKPQNPVKSLAIK